MTREEAKHIVDVAFAVPLAVRRIGEDRTYQEDEIREAKKMAIKALEQDSILDKIRAEIEQDAFKDVNGSKFISVNRVNQIIDKYGGE